MKSLPDTLNKKGFEYKLVQRNNRAAIYAQYFENKLLAYEIFKIVIAKPYTLGGKQFEGGEVFPGDEAFGMWAWSYGVFSNQDKALQKAIIQFNNLTTKEDERTEKT